MRAKQRSSQWRVPRASFLLTLTTIILFSCSQQSLAQQRDGDATNADSNSSSASNGRVNFNIIQLMNGEYLEMFGAGTSRGILRGHPTMSGIELGSLSADPLMFSTNSVERMRIMPNGFVGIGTNAPGTPLELFTPDANSYSPTSTTSARIRLINSTATPNNAFEIDLGAFDTNGAPSSGARLVSIFTNHAPNAMTADFAIGLRNVGAWSEIARFTSTGNVGIGTDNPAKKLHIFSSNSQVMIDRSANTAGNYALVNFATNRVTKFLIGMNADTDSGDKLSFFEMAFSTLPVMTITGGRLGIGTTVPAHKLDVVGEIRASGGFRFADGTLQTTAAVGGSSAVSSVFGRTGAVVPATNDYTWAQINKSTSSLADIQTRSAGDLNAGTVPIARLGVSGIPDATTFLRGDNTWATVSGGPSQWTTTSGTNNISYNSGNVGIGTTNPTVKLEVIGDIKITGNINAKYQDVAEWVDSSQELVAGTVVVLDSSRSNHVIAATESYDSRIAGVISLRPGLTLGEEAEGRVLVATTGRVRVKVDATEGAIQIGDLLVTSNREGFAMKSLPVDVGGVRMHRPGTLIGKALEPLAKGTGEILVLLSLQ